MSDFRCWEVQLICEASHNITLPLILYEPKYGTQFAMVAEHSSVSSFFFLVSGMIVIPSALVHLDPTFPRLANSPTPTMFCQHVVSASSFSTRV